MAAVTTRRQNLDESETVKVKRSKPVGADKGGRSAAAKDRAANKTTGKSGATGAAKPARSRKPTAVSGHGASGAVVAALKAEAGGRVARAGLKKDDVAKSACRTLKLEAEGLEQLMAALAGRMARPFSDAVKVLHEAHGRVIVTGIGKSGHIGQKIAATLASTGTTAHFVHPSEASHGDLGMITRDDAVLAISWSGETVELASILTYSRRFAVPLVSITSQAQSALGRSSDVCLELPRAKEACPHGLAPTTSTTMTLALGDCLAIALLEAKGFSALDFKEFHPGGSLGARLKYVSDIMHTGDRLPIVADTAIMGAALLTMTEKSFGCVGVVDGKGRLIGMITDGDLRRHMGPNLLTSCVREIMNGKPDTLKASELASAALEQINARKRTQMFVVEKGKPIGIVHVHDLLRAGVS